MFSPGARKIVSSLAFETMLACVLGRGQNGHGEDLGGLPALIDICEQVAESLSAFIIDGEVTGSQGIGLDRESIESHLRVCAYCSTLPENGRVPPPPERSVSV